MFKRFKKKSTIKRIFNFFWPSIGWKKSIIYALHRLNRLPGSEYSIASGFACGAAISFTPFVGLHFVLGGIWAYIIRGNIFASIIGTAIGNPWTFPFIWVWLYHIGNWLILAPNNRDLGNFNFNDLFKNVIQAAIDMNLNLLISLAKPILWPMLVGSIPSMIFVWIIFYFALRKLIQHSQMKKK